MDPTHRRNRNITSTSSDTSENHLIYDHGSLSAAQLQRASNADLDTASALADTLFRTSIGDRPLTLSMHLAVNVPDRLVAGVALNVPIVVVFHVAVACEIPEPRDLGKVTTESNLSGYWMFLSLVTEDRSKSVAPPENNLLNGRTTDSIHMLVDSSEDRDKPVAYAKFSGLSVSKPGRYCFQINMVDMNRPDQRNSNFATCLPVLHSRAFEVVGYRVEHEIDVPSSRAIAQLRTFGVNL